MPTTFYRDLECTLTDDELDRKRDELAAAVLDKDRVADERRELMGRLGAKIKGLDGTIHSLSEQVTTRQEERPVRCERVRDGENFKIAVMRTDTGECLEVRDMTDEERDALSRKPADVVDIAVVRAIRDRERAEKKIAQEKADATAKAEADFDITAAPGISNAVAGALTEAGFGTLDALRGAAPKDLTSIKGVGSKKAEKLLLWVEETFPLPDDGDEGSPVAVDDESDDEVASAADDGVNVPDALR